MTDIYMVVVSRLGYSRRALVTLLAGVKRSIASIRCKRVGGGGVKSDRAGAKAESLCTESEARQACADVEVDSCILLTGTQLLT